LFQVPPGFSDTFFPFHFAKLRAALVQHIARSWPPMKPPPPQTTIFSVFEIETIDKPDGGDPETAAEPQVAQAQDATYISAVKE
jgi:hypothetical protein